MATGFGSTFGNDLASLIFKALPIANIADNASSSPLTSLYVSLHTAALSPSSNQNTSEAAYTGYARVAVARSGSGWVVTGEVITPAATISFPAATGGSEVETYAAVGTASSGTGKILAFGPISPTITVSNGVTPQLDSTSSFTLA